MGDPNILEHLGLKGPGSVAPCFKVKPAHAALVDVFGAEIVAAADLTEMETSKFRTLLHEGLTALFADNDRVFGSETITDMTDIMTRAIRTIIADRED